MYLSLKLAVKKLLRSPGSYVFQGIVLFVFLFITFTAILINNGAARGILKVNRDFGAEVRLTPDNTSSQNSFYLSESIGNRYTSLKYIKGYNYHFSVDIKSDLEYKGEKTVVVGKDEKLKIKADSENTFTLVGDSNPAGQSDFTTGKLELFSGRFYSEEDVRKKSACAVVSRQLAEDNNLKVGNTIRIYSANSKKELQIVGIFDNAVTGKDANNSLYADKIYVPLGISQEFREDKKMPEDVLTYVSYFIDEHDKFAMLGKNITSNEKKKFIISVYDDGYKAKTELLRNIWKVSWVFIIGSILGSILYILSHVYYTVKKRSYETGVFYTMGLNRWTVFKQLVIELILVSVIAVVAAGILSITESDRFSGYVQKVCIKQTEDLETATMNKMEYIEADKTDPGIFTATDYGSENLTVAIETKAGLKQWGLFLAAAFIVILSGILATVLKVLKYNPIEDFQKSIGGV